MFFDLIIIINIYLIIKNNYKNILLRKIINLLSYKNRGFSILKALI